MSELLDEATVLCPAPVSLRCVYFARKSQSDAQTGQPELRRNPFKFPVFDAGNKSEPPSLCDFRAAMEARVYLLWF